MKVATILATKGPNVITINADKAVKDAITLLAEKRIGAMVVFDTAGKVCGIFSERDVIRALAQFGPDLFTKTVQDLMTRRVVFGSPQDDIEAVKKTMTEKRFRHLPIMEDDQLVGMISIGDLVKASLDESLGELETLQTQIDAD